MTMTRALGRWDPYDELDGRLHDLDGRLEDLERETENVASYISVVETTDTQLQDLSRETSDWIRILNEKIEILARRLDRALAEKEANA